MPFFTWHIKLRNWTTTLNTSSTNTRNLKQKSHSALWCPHGPHRCSSNPLPGGQDAPDKMCLAQRCQEKPFSTWRQIAKSLSRISLRDGLILHMKGSRTRKTAPAQGKVLVNSGLKARLLLWCAASSRLQQGSLGWVTAPAEGTCQSGLKSRNRTLHFLPAFPPHSAIFIPAQ